MTAPASQLLEITDGSSTQKVFALRAGRTVEPMSVGRTGKWAIEAAGVRDLHGYLYFDGEALFLRSVALDQPVLVDGEPLPCEWTRVDPPSAIVLGSASITLRVEGEDGERDDFDLGPDFEDGHLTKRAPSAAGAPSSSRRPGVIAASASSATSAASGGARTPLPPAVAERSRSSNPPPLPSRPAPASSPAPSSSRDSGRASAPPPGGAAISRSIQPTLLGAGPPPRAQGASTPSPIQFGARPASVAPRASASGAPPVPVRVPVPVPVPAPVPVAVSVPPMSGGASGGASSVPLSRRLPSLHDGLDEDEVTRIADVTELRLAAEEADRNERAAAAARASASKPVSFDADTPVAQPVAKAFAPSTHEKAANASGANGASGAHGVYSEDSMPTIMAEPSPLVQSVLAGDGGYFPDGTGKAVLPAAGAPADGSRASRPSNPARPSRPMEPPTYRISGNHPDAETRSRGPTLLVAVAFAIVAGGLAAWHFLGN